MTGRGTAGGARSVALALAFALALASCGKEPPGSHVLARVAGHPITDHDVDARLQDVPQLARPEYAGPVGRERMVRQMVEEEVLFRAATDAHLDRDPEIRRRVDSSARQILVQAYLDREQARMSQVDEKEMRAFYEQHKDEYHTERLLKVRLLVARTRPIAERVREMALAGQPFDQLCVKFSDDLHVKEAKGMLPTWIRRDRAIPWLGNFPVFHQVVFSLEKGKLSDVFETAKGFHVARVEDIREERQRTFEESRADIEERLKRDRSSKGLPEIVEALKKRYDVKMVEPAKKTPEQLFAEAQAAADAATRITLYQELIDQYPKDAHVVDALFMIGFTRAEDLHDSTGAKVAFQRVIEQFPESELAQSARWMLTSEGAAGPPPGVAQAESAAAGKGSP